MFLSLSLSSRPPLSKEPGEHRLWEQRRRLFLEMFDTHGLCFIPWAVLVFLPGAPLPPTPCIGFTFQFHSFQSQSLSSRGELYVWCSSLFSGVCALAGLANTRLTLVYWFRPRVLQLAIGSFIFFRHFVEEPLKV